MNMYRILYNPEAGNGKGKQETEKLVEKMSDAAVELYDMTKLNGYADFFAACAPEDRILIAGGDGTLNRFLNDTAALTYPNSVWYYPVGSGNDFWRDVTDGTDTPLCIDRYIVNLPTVEVNGKTYRVLNGVGYGIDGYCCEVGDRLRKTSEKPVNYAAIAIKGLLFHFRPVNAKITVDGVTHEFRKVWLAPTMNGHYYGGGMMPTPAQDRLGEEHTVSTMVMYGTGKLRTLMIFPSIFKGEHVRHKNAVEVMTGRDITVTFDRPTALQIDGETILGVTSCRIRAAAKVPEFSH